MTRRFGGRSWPLGMALVALAACGPPPTRGPEPAPVFRLERNPRGSPPQHAERILAQDPAAAEAVYFVNHRQGRLPSGQIQIEVDLETRTQGSGYWLEWKVVFYDAERFAVEETEWQSLHLAPASVSTLRANSITPDAQDYSLLLRSAP